MRKKQSFVLVICLIAVLLPAVWCVAKDKHQASAFVGQDLHLAGRELISYQISGDPASREPTEQGPQHILVFQNGFSMSFAANRFSSDSAVVWLASAPASGAGLDRVLIDYKATVYLQGNISVEKAKGTETTDLSLVAIEAAPEGRRKGQVMVVRFGFRGEVFVTAEKREVADPRGLELYAEALAAIQPVEPELQPKPEAPEPEKPAKEVVPAKPEEKEPIFIYPINIAPAGEVAPKIEWDEKAKIGTVIGRFYLWQKQDERGGLLELQADNAVIFYSEQADEQSREIVGFEDILARAVVQAIYLAGDVVMTEGQRTIRADEIYYDFQRKKALAINVVMRNFDVSRGIPIYVRAAKLRQLAENKFAAENPTLTTSEFYLPQISLNASQIIITDTTPVDQRADRLSDRSFDAQMRDVRLKMYDKTIFYWPFLRSNLQRPDVPLKGANVGNDRTWGTSVETQWYLARLLGLAEPEGTDSTITLDYYSKRGPGSGLEIDYTRENYFGRILGYIIDDSGKDRLGRTSSRKDLEPPRNLRGRFRWQHKHFLPFNWQLATEVSYASDRNFIEQFYRNEFNTDKEQETIVHLKRIQDNWGLAFLGKARLNDFNSKVEEFPSAEFHWTGQSLFDDRFTFYSDNQISRFRQRLASGSTSTMLQNFFTFASTRNELDLPITLGRSKVVPFVAGTFGYDDGSGFRTNIDGTTAVRDDAIWFGEAGVRASTQPYWKEYPNVKSRLWDLNKLRHTIQPRVAAIAYTQDDSVIEQRDTLNVGISQRLQTKRGSGNKQRTVDWMRLDMDVTWVNDSGDTSAGPDRFIWNKPFIPLANRYSRRLGEVMLPPQDRRSSDIFGPRRNYFSTDYIWRLTDTTAFLSDMNFDMQSGVVQQLNIGFSQLHWPNLSYYIGSRYLRRVRNNLGEKGSNAFTFAATYELDPRYTAVFSQQYDFDYGVNIRSDITLIRQYHRLFFAITYSVDESLDQHSVVFSLWPQGVPEMAMGPRRYMRTADSAGY
ncbi:MAG: LPS assembly protein LptD [Phycisphaerae bacterium]